MPFFCHSHAPHLGLRGELAEMVRADMTLAQAVALHNKNWNFGGALADAQPFIHEASHQLLAIAALYEPELRFLLPRVNPETGNLLPSGYNGFGNAEGFVGGIEYFMLGELKKSPLDMAVLKSNYMRATKNVYSGDPVQNIDFFGWARQMEKPENAGLSLFEVKYKNNFDTDIGEGNSAEELSKLNGPLHPEMLLDSMPLTEDHFSKLFDRLKPVLPLFMNKPEDKWGDIKIRDLHRTIGGDAAAERYFSIAEGRVVIPVPQSAPAI